MSDEINKLKTEVLQLNKDLTKAIELLATLSAALVEQGKDLSYLASINKEHSDCILDLANAIVAVKKQAVTPAQFNPNSITAKC